jgi:hypothetical protein
MNNKTNAIGATVPCISLLAESDYDSGYLNDYGGGNAGWWQDYIRAEVGRCNDYWRSKIVQLADSCPANARLNRAAVSLSDCLDEINNALNYWYPLKADSSEDERNARHVRLFEFRDRLAKQLKANAPVSGGTPSAESDCWASEAEQVAAFLKTRSASSRDTQNDYLFMGRAPDVIELIDGNLHSFEMKLRNWKQAVTQARDHQLIADYAWIVIPKPKAEWVEGTGIGLIDGESFEVVVDAARQTPLACAKRDQLITRYWPNAALTGADEGGVQ